MLFRLIPGGMNHQLTPFPEGDPEFSFQSAIPILIGMRVPGQSAKSAMFSRCRRIFFCGKSQRRPKVRREIDRFRMPSSHEDGTFFRTSRSGPRKNLFRSPGTDAQERTRIHLRITAQISPPDREILSLPHRIRSTGIRKKQGKELLQSTGKNRHVFRRGRY